ncbi:UDP-N-acetylmuramate dehydrogenase [Pedobacter westerhofensis]|uniref:UDP-N-acetylenolpyruvoylglucosamine reductase n=1 Tax=Pedobacter westerhofensis TaxID=425512 RepID=A0A521BYZ7_9SPHI|nr:UDP-N-acetylmuramate dehydrogenase [Pedobacter westerhofensis]SMO52384.1 UDP-N-acetylmuramate dehydrogenase [Pedobacter westerhofensis]
MYLLQENKSLKSYNTFGIDVKARFFAEINNEEDLRALRLDPVFKENQLLVLGGGSNMLFTKDFDGLVLKVSIPGIRAARSAEDEDQVLVTAGAGIVWNDLVNYCVEQEFAGMENLSLIPGTVGASPIQNIGAYGVELKDIFESCTAFEIATGEFKIFDFEDCHFAYRDSIFKNDLKGQYLITAVTFRLNTQARINSQYGAIQSVLAERGIRRPTIADISKIVAEIRVSKLPDPSTIGNAGSFFKNPIIGKAEYESIIQTFPDLISYPAGKEKVKLAAGWLIESCGFKGIVDGNTGTWKNQALVLVNHGQATGTEVYSFSEKIIDTVEAKFGVKLEREVNIL